MHDFSEKEKLIYARHLLEGNATTWYLAHKRKMTTWSEFERQFLGRFADDGISCANAFFARYQYQNEIFRAYADSLLGLHDRLFSTGGRASVCSYKSIHKWFAARPQRKSLCTSS